jgi:hypothetical protein
MSLSMSGAEENLVSMELRSEAAVCILKSFLVSHGYVHVNDWLGLHVNGRLATYGLPSHLW